MGRSSFLCEYRKAHVQSPDIFYEDYYPGQERLFLKKNGMEFPKVGRGWGENSRSKNKGLRLYLRNPLFLFGEPCRDRTDNLLIKSQLLYRLS
jgi:hypothetical protein